MMNFVTAGDLLTLSELQGLRARSAPRGAWLVIHAWAIIAGAMLLCAVWPSALTFGLGILVIGGRQLGLTVLMHEASHWLVFPGPAGHKPGGSRVFAPPGPVRRAPALAGRPRPPPRRRHPLPPRPPQRAGDPALELAAAAPMSRRRFWWAVA